MLEQAKFSRYTKILREAFPRWSDIRKDPYSIGAQFLAVTGLQLDEVEWYLEYAHNQYYINTADLLQADVIYKAQIPGNIDASMLISFMGASHTLPISATVEEFLATVKASRENPTITSWNPCFIDFTAKYIYVLKPYDQNETNKYGYITLNVFDPVAAENAIEENLLLELHHVWNFFDEFGLLLGLTRLQGEPNEHYKKRLIDVFRRPADSTKTGMLNAIVRELGLTQEVTWRDGGKPLTLPTPQIDVKSIYVDRVRFPQDLITYDSSGLAVLAGRLQYAGIEQQVTYNASITFHEMHDRNDKVLQSELYRVDGTAMPLLQYYIDIISNRIPIMWGQWKWDESFWDIANEEVSGYGKTPSFTDGKISSWKSYSVKEG